MLRLNILPDDTPSSTSSSTPGLTPGSTLTSSSTLTQSSTPSVELIAPYIGYPSINHININNLTNATECIYVIRAGPRRGRRCNIPLRSLYCSEHASKTHYELITDESNPQCNYVITAGANRGERCSLKRGGKYCHDHYAGSPEAVNQRRIESDRASARSMEEARHIVVDENQRRQANSLLDSYISRQNAAINRIDELLTAAGTTLTRNQASTTRRNDGVLIGSMTTTSRNPPSTQQRNPAPVTPVSIVDRIVNIDLNDVCPICQDKLIEANMSVRACVRGGMHPIHQECLQEWTRSCPNKICFVCQN